MLDRKDATALIARRHPEWVEHQRHWRWMADSLEGGDRYRHADYTVDPTSVGPRHVPSWMLGPADPQTGEAFSLTYGRVVQRNLVPHLREMGAADRDLYAMRLSRTPVPHLLERAVESHLSRIYSREVVRDGPDALEAWWQDVDGRGTPIGRWMQETVAPLFAALGSIDVLFDHPSLQPGADVRSRGDQAALGLDACVASVVLPESIVWWRLDTRGRYVEALLFDRLDDGAVYRHWTPTAVDTYTTDGRHVPDESRDHPFGRVPIVRVFDRRLTRCEHVGRSRYASIAAIQKAVYNARSELILSDVQQSHAQLVLPEEYLQPGNEVPVGPDHALPMRPIRSNGQVSGYQPPIYLDPPKGAQAEVRQHVLDWLDEADRDAALAKPAGIASGSSTAQSGVAKVLDQTDGNALLTSLSRSLAAAESAIAAFALAVLFDGRAPSWAADAVSITYPCQFDLHTLDDLAKVGDDVERLAAGMGALPRTEAAVLKRIVAVALPGLQPDEMGSLHREIDAFAARAAGDVRPGADDGKGEVDVDPETQDEPENRDRPHGEWRRDADRGHQG